MIANPVDTADGRRTDADVESSKPIRDEGLRVHHDCSSLLGNSLERVEFASWRRIVNKIGDPLELENRVIVR